MIASESESEGLEHASSGEEENSGTEEENSGTEEETENEESDNDRTEIRGELSKMSFEELAKLKEELGSKVYNEAVFGTTSKKKKEKQPTDLKRLNKNRPREQSAKRTVPFLDIYHGEKKKNVNTVRDPRFDDKSGEYDPKLFKDNYSFVDEIREKEIRVLKRKLNRVTETEEKANIKFLIQRLENKNRENKRYKEKEEELAIERSEINKAIKEGRTPHYTTKKERRAKELVKQFIELKKSGKLDKHMEKRRKKNTAKDRKKFSFD